MFTDLKRNQDKSSLTRELEKMCEKIELFNNGVETCLIIDVMLIMRKLS